MKYLPILLLLLSTYAFAGEPYNSGIGSVSPQQQYAIDTAIHNEKARRYNMKQLRSIPTGETYEEASRRRDNSLDEFYEALGGH